MSLHDGIASLNSPCDGRAVDGKPCQFSSFAIIKRRYLGEVVRLCDECFAEEINVVGIDRLAELLHWRKEQKAKARERDARIGAHVGSGKVIPVTPVTPIRSKT